MSFWNKIVNFFTGSLPDFMNENWLIIESVCMGIILLGLLVGILQHRRVKRLNKTIKANLEEITSKDRLLSTKDNRIGNILKEKEELENNMIANKTDFENTLCTKDVEIKAMSESFEARIDELNRTIDSLEADKVLLQTNLDELVIAKTELDNEHLDLLDKNEELNRTVLSYSERYEELEKKNNALIIENDFLKNYETENAVLIKTLRRLKEDEENDAAKAKDAIVALENRLNKKIESTFEAMTAKIVLTSTKLKNLDADLSSLKRPELSKIAKDLGITNFATWSNDKLIDEIKKYKV